jgi:hypothetical protein
VTFARAGFGDRELEFGRLAVLRLTCSLPLLAEVDALPAVEAVLASASQEPILATGAADAVSTAPSHDPVVSTEPDDDIRFIRAPEDVRFLGPHDRGSFSEALGSALGGRIHIRGLDEG